MKSITINLYNIKELKEINEEAYNKVINNERDNIIDIRFNYASSDVSERLLNKYNLHIDRDGIYYSISYCQGDGVCFVTNNGLLRYSRLKNKDNINAFEKWILNNLSDKEMKLLLDYLNSGYNLNIIKNSHHYCHAYTCSIDYEYFYSSDDNNYIDDMNNFICNLTTKLFNEVYLIICEDIEKYLYSFYEIEEEDIVRDLIDNDFLYNKDGNLYA